MKLEPQCKTYPDLLREMLRLHTMCEGTKLNPLAGLKVTGRVWTGACGGTPAFNDKPEIYEFALATVQDRFVFRGDTLYSSALERTFIVFCATERGLWDADDRGGIFNHLSWAAPKPEAKPAALISDNDEFQCDLAAAVGGKDFATGVILTGSQYDTFERILAVVKKHEQKAKTA